MITRILHACGLLAMIAAVGGAELDLVKVNYITSVPLKLYMDTDYNIKVELVFNNRIPQGATNFTVKFESRTLSPQFNILELDSSGSTISISRKQLEGSKFVLSSSLRLRPTYIGHAMISPVLITSDALNHSSRVELSSQLPVTIVKSNEGDIWTIIFIASVSVLITISYINLGAQLDVENLKETIKKPQALILGFLVTVLVMPLISWLIGMWLLKDQLLYRVGSFIFACCPTASASTLWTVMFNSDKELSISLQAISTIGSLVTMPLLLYFMESALQLEGAKHAIKVPYARLIQTLLGLVVALLIGWYFIGRHERAQKISTRIFKPLTFFILLFIIVFSSIVYWYIYAMFDWTITLTALMITLATYCLSGLLGFLVSFNVDRAIAISISGTYKNSGIAFAVLLVAFDSPDTYINYVPCLTQVLTTSIILYLIYSSYSLVNCIKRRNQPDPIQATSPAEEDITEAKKKSSRSGSCQSEKSTKEAEENDEFIAMNVTDVVAGSPEITPPVTGDSK